jgi:trans-aconitate methyltransferase
LLSFSATVVVWVDGEGLLPLLPNQWAEVNQAFLEHCLVILEKEVIDTISHKYLN